MVVIPRRCSRIFFRTRPSSPIHLVPCRWRLLVSVVGRRLATYCSTSGDLWRPRWADRHPRSNVPRECHSNLCVYYLNCRSSAAFFPLPHEVSFFFEISRPSSSLSPHCFLVLFPSFPPSLLLSRSVVLRSRSAVVAVDFFSP